MRVVHFGYADLLPGAARASFRLHRALVAQGVDSHMLVARRLGDDSRVHGPDTPIGRWWAHKANALDIRATRLLAADEPEVSGALFGSAVIRKIDRLQPDVVTLHWLAGGLVRPEAWPRLRKHALVWRLPDTWPFSGVRHYSVEPSAPLSTQRGTRFDRWMTRRKHAAIERLPDLTIVCPSRWMEHRVHESELLGTRRTEVIATGVDLEQYQPVDARSARRQLGLPDDGRRLVLFGAMGGDDNPRKGFRELRAAIGHLQSAAAAPAADLVTFGVQADSSLPGSHRVDHLGRVDDEARLVLAYSAVDVFVAPSLAENLANTVLESLACGTPVVAFDIGGMPDAIDHGVTGWLAPGGDAAGLAAGIRHVLELDDIRSTVARKAARATALERFDLHRQVSKYVDLYAELTSRKLGGRYPRPG